MSRIVADGFEKGDLARSCAAGWVAMMAVLCVAPAAGQEIDWSRYTIVDLTHPFNDRTVYWPTAPSGFQLHREAWGETPAGYFYSSFSLCTPEHGGTHLDAPLHFAANARSTADIPLDQLIGPAVVLDVRTKADADRNYLLTSADITTFEQKYGRIEPGTIVLVRTGWSRFWPDRRAYLGDETRGPAARLSFPGISPEAARVLVEDRQAAVLGIDTASIDHGPSTDFMAHRVGAPRGVPNLENLTNLDQLPPRGAIVLALPMKIDGGSGGPVRVAALVPKRM